MASTLLCVIVFDKYDKYCAILGSTQVTILSLIEGQIGEEIEKYTLENTKY